MLTATTGTMASYKLTLKGDGITVERDISETLAKNIITMILGESASSASAATAASANSVLVQPNNKPISNDSVTIRKSLREYFSEVDAKKNPQKILAIASYLTKYKGQQLFSIADIRPQFKVANEPIPANLHRDFQIVLQNNWIAADHEERKMYYITQTGINELEKRFE